MNMRSLYRKPAMVIPFIHHKHHGRVVIYYGKNDDSVKVGFDIIPNLIENFSSLGYRMLFGWIQIITDEYQKSSGGKKRRLNPSI